MEGDDREARGPDDTGRGDEDVLAELVCQYMDRLIEGEELDTEEVLREYPQLGPAILRELTTFSDIARESEPGDSEPLGTLGDYTLRRQIGRGGMGVVYEAWENSLERPVALKVLPSGAAADDRTFHRFMREARTAGKLSHPNVVPVFGVGIRERTPYYAMEYVEGETLAQILERERDAPPEEKTSFGFPADNVAYYSTLAGCFADVADGLQHAHSRGVIHRDVKPSNLILDREGRLRILDFGLARLEGQDSLTISGDFIGTPLYMSPEQARQRRIRIDHRTDIYSLGATMYEALTHRPPFRGKDHRDTLSQIIERDPVEPRKGNPRIPLELETIVLQCLRKEPADRYGTAEALAQDLRRFVRGDPVEARPQGSWDRLWRRLQRNRIRFIVATVLFTLAAACGALLVTLWIDARTEARQQFEATVIEAAVKLPRGELLLAGALQLAWNTFSLRPVDVDFPAESARDLMEGAIDQLTGAIGEFPHRFEGYYYRARALHLLGREEEAAADLRKVLRLQPGFVPALTLLVEVSGESTLPGGMQHPVPVEPTGWSSDWVRAQQAAGATRWEAAAATYGDLIAEDETGAGLYLGSSLDLYLRRGVAHLRSKRFEEARRDFWGAHILTRRTRPGAVEPLLLLGITYCVEQLTTSEPLVDRANEYFETAFDLSTEEERDEVALWLARLHRDFRSDERALEWAGRVATRPRHRSSLEVSIYLGLGRYREAVEAARTWTRLAPEDPAALHGLGGTLLRFFWVSAHCPVPTGERASLEEVSEFLAVSESVQSAALRDPSVHLLLSRVCRDRGDLERAREFLESAGRVLGECAAKRKSARPDHHPEIVTTELGEGYFVEESPLSHDTGVNSPFAEFQPSISPDGRRLYFTSDRPDEESGSGWNLHVATRDGEAFGDVTRLDRLNSQHNDFGPHVSSDGRELYFTSGRAGSFDIYVSRWDPAEGEFGSPEPLDEINSPDHSEGAPCLSRDGRELYFDSRNRPGGPGGEGSDLFVAWRSDRNGPFRDVRPLNEISSPFHDFRPSLSRDGKTLFWAGLHTDSQEGTPGVSHVWSARRESTWNDAEDRPVPFDRNTVRKLSFSDLAATPCISSTWPDHLSKLYYTSCLPGLPCSQNDPYYNLEIEAATWKVGRPGARAFLRGNADGRGGTDFRDVLFILGRLFLGARAPNCLDAADTDDSGDLSITDAVLLLGFLYLGGPPPPEPVGKCGADPTRDGLGCEVFPRCDGG